MSDYSNEHIAVVSATLSRLHQFVGDMDRLRISNRENAHLRALCLFCPDGAPDILTCKLQHYQMKVLRSLRTVCQLDDGRAAMLLQLPHSEIN